MKLPKPLPLQTIFTRTNPDTGAEQSAIMVCSVSVPDRPEYSDAWLEHQVFPDGWGVNRSIYGVERGHGFLRFQVLATNAVVVVAWDVQRSVRAACRPEDYSKVTVFTHTALPPPPPPRRRKGSPRAGVTHSQHQPRLAPISTTYPQPPHNR